MTTPELKPCPFCGGTANLIDDGIHGRVRCTRCGAQTDYEFSYCAKGDGWKAVVAERWNARIDEERQPVKDIVHDRCPNCDSWVDSWREGQRFCPYCGQKLKLDDHA